MKLMLANGQKAEVKVYYEILKKKRYGKHYRGATIKLTIGEHTYTGTSVCSPKDTFNRLFGRKVALINLFKPDKDKKIFSKEDRTMIFKTICSKFFKKS